METHDLIQGSQQWHEHRRKHFNASDAAAMMGRSPYMSRDDLLLQMFTGERPEPSDYEQSLYELGHRVEALARPKAEEIIGEALYPITATREVEGLPLSASYDGLTIGCDVACEIKAYSKKLEGVMFCEEVLHHDWQIEQQLLVSGASKVLFVAAKMVGDDVEITTLWRESDPYIREKLIAGWHIFKEDLDSFAPYGTSLEEEIIYADLKLKEYCEEKGIPLIKVDYMDATKFKKTLKSKISEVHDAVAMAKINQLIRSKDNG